MAATRNNKVSASVRNVDRLKAKLASLGEDGQRAINMAVKITAMAIRNDAVMSIRNPPKTGNVYGKLSDVRKVNLNLRGAKSASKRVHQASRAGEAPALDTGTLANSINVTAGRINGVAQVSVDAEYGAALEFGTKKNGRQDIYPRPFMRPAIENNRQSFPKMINDFMLSTIKQVNKGV